MKRVIALAAGTLGVVALAGCGGRLFPSFQPEARLDPPSGHYSDGIWVQTSGEPGERYYWSPDPRATIDEFEPLHDIYVAADTTFRYFAISSHGIRSPIIEAEYIIDDEGAPVVDPAALFRANITYYRFDLIWEVIPPWEADGIDDQDPSPFDAVTEWESLEYAVYSSAADDIGSLAEAEANGRLEMDWLTLEQNGGSPSYRYFASRPGEPRYFNVFVRDAEGNATAYGTRRFATRPALSVYIGTDTTDDDQVRLHDTVSQPRPTFVRRTITYPESRVKAVDLARIDGDLFEDLAVVRSDASGDYYRWYKAQGDGTFALETEVHFEGPSANPRQIRIADMTGDGQPELVYNTGLGDLQVSSTTGGLIAAFAADAEGFATGDVNGDGLNDIVSRGAAPGAENVSVWLNDGGGTFTGVAQPWTAPGPGGLVSNDVQLADLDRDGSLDLIVAVADALLPDPTVNIAWGQGDGTFVEATGEQAFWNAEHDTQSVAVADFDRDGDPDLFFSNSTPPSLVYINNGDRTFSPGPDTESGSSALGAIAADMNGDGWPDIIENHVNDVQLWINLQGSGIDTTPIPFTANSPRSYAVGQVR